MIFHETKLKDAFVIELDKIVDERGFYARAWCQKELEKRGLNASVVQTNIQYSKKRGTLRGLHYQIHPYGEAKLIRCFKGAIYNVIIDLRPDSSTYKQWISVEINEDNYRMLYVPEGFANGHQSLKDNTVVTYQVSQFYTPNSERGIRWNDPLFRIEWPLDVSLISDKDKNWPDYALQIMRNDGSI